MSRWSRAPARRSRPSPPRSAKAGGAADTLVLDLQDVAAAERAIAAAEPFDVLVNNAGTNRPKPFTEVIHDDYDAVMRTSTCAPPSSSRRR